GDQGSLNPSLQYDLLRPLVCRTLFGIAFSLSDMYSLPVHALSFHLRMYPKQLLIKDLATQSRSIEDSWRSVPLPPTRLFSRGGGIYANRSVWMWISGDGCSRLSCRLWCARHRLR